MILKYCDDETLLKLSQVNRRMRNLLLFNQSHQGKDFKIRILQFKLSRNNKNLDRVVDKIGKGELIDV
jgi:hypothetical protein